DVDIVGGRFDGTMCGSSVYGVMTGGPIYGTVDGGDPEPRNPAYESACDNAARPEWETGKGQLRVAIPLAATATALALAATYVWLGVRRRDDEH
ncbi:MAG: hypothetical protein ACJ74E_02345, partial [Actinomycetes bacterium]